MIINSLCCIVLMVNPLTGIPSDASSSVVVPSGAGSNSLRHVLIVTLVIVLGLFVSALVWIVMRQRKRGMLGDDEDGDDVEYSRLVQKSSRNDHQ